MDQKNVQSSIHSTKIDSKQENDAKTYEAYTEEGSLQKVGFFASHWHGLVETLSVETGGIQRVTDGDRQHNPTHVWNAATFW